MPGVAVEVGATGRDQFEFGRELAQRCAHERWMVGVIDLEAGQAGVTQRFDKLELHTLRTSFVMTYPRMSDDRSAAGLPDQSHRVVGGERLLGNIGLPAIFHQCLREGLSHVIDVAPSDHRARDMRTRHDAATGLCAYLVHRQLIPERAQLLDDADSTVDPRCNDRLEFGVQLAGARIEEVPEHVDVGSIVDGRELDPRNDAHADLTSGLRRFGNTIDCVVVGHRDDINAVPSRTRDELRRRKHAIRSCRMTVKVDAQHRATLGAPTAKEVALTVTKTIDLSGSSTQSLEAAIGEAVSRAALTISDVHEFEVQKITGTVKDGSVDEYRVWLKATFVVKETLHE